MLAYLKKICCCTSTSVDIKTTGNQQVPPKVQFNNFFEEPSIPKPWLPEKQVSMIPAKTESISPQTDIKEAYASSPTPEEMDHIVDLRRPFVFPPELPLREDGLPSIKKNLEDWEFSEDLVSKFNERCETPETCTGSQRELALAYTAYQTAWLCTQAIRRPLPLPRKN